MFLASIENRSLIFVYAGAKLWKIGGGNITLSVISWAL